MQQRRVEEISKRENRNQVFASRRIMVTCCYCVRDVRGSSGSRQIRRCMLPHHTHTHSYTTALLICIDCVRQSTFYSMFRVISIRNDGRDAVDWQRLEKSGPFSFFAFDARICLIGRGHLSLIKIWNSNFESNESIFVAARIAHFIIIFRNKEQRTTIYDFQLMWNRRSTFQWIAESRVITLRTFFTSNFR